MCWELFVHFLFLKCLSDAQRLTPGSVRGTIWIPIWQIQVCCMQGKYPTLAPVHKKLSAVFLKVVS